MERLCLGVGLGSVDFIAASGGGGEEWLRGFICRGGLIDVLGPGNTQFTRQHGREFLIVV